MKILTALLLSLLALAPEEPRRPQILGVAHISLYVSDINKSRSFYKDFLGYEEPFKLDKPDGSLALTFIKINEDQYIELVPGLQPGADRLNHISLYTNDAEGLRAYLGSQGVKVPARVSKGRTGNSSFNVKDPEGHTVEFVQYEPDSWSSREKGRFMGESRISTRMRHLGILVTHLEAEAAFYGKILGFQETWRGSSTGKVLSWVNMKVPDGTDYLEFMLQKELPAPDKRGTAHHICLETPDLGKALATLEARPSRQTYGRPLEGRVGINRRRLSNLYDPDGTRVELMEPGTVDGTPTPSSTAPPPE
jgi:lactoylglutathione lyase